MLKIEEGMFVRTKYEILKLRKKNENGWFFNREKMIIKPDNIGKYIIGASYNLIDLVQYMDLLEIENRIKLYGLNKEIILFNPVRCDGFTEYDDGTHCIILNLDYIVDVKDLKIKKILTHEQFENNCYKVEE